MKTVKSFIALILITTLISSCKKNEWRFISGKGETVTENRSESNFKKIHLSVDATVNFVQDSVYKIQISAQQNILNVLTTKIEGEKLVIGFNVNVRKHNPIHIIIHSPVMYGFEISGSGNINSYNKIKTSSLDLAVSGSGDIYLREIDVTNLNTNISGSGNTNIESGNAVNENFTVSGSGNCDALNVVSVTNKSKISGSGDLKTHCAEQLDVTISGSGNVTYKGLPAVKSVISGSGKLIHIN